MSYCAINYKRTVSILVIFTLLFLGCTHNKSEEKRIVFLHHSTGAAIWRGNSISPLYNFVKRISGRLANIVAPKAQLPSLFENYNKVNKTAYLIQEIEFPKVEPYGWHNYPFDYYNIWVKNAGVDPFMEEPTLEILTSQYQIVIFKHCFPVSNIQADIDTADINSNKQTLANYKLQYNALKNKLHLFPDTKFILFTGAAQVESLITEDEATRARDFFTWVRDEWDLPDDNIFLWDLYSLQTENGLFFKNEYAISPQDSHPNPKFADKVVQLLFNRIIDISENNGTTTSLTGEPMPS